MTAGSGILHEEFHSERFAKEGGNFHMLQLWVNLPAKDKMTEPAYQAILNQQIPSVELPQSSGSARVIAGSYEGYQGPAKTFTPMHVIDLKIKQGATVTIPAPEGWNTSLVILKGAVSANGSVAKEAQMLMFSKDGEDIQITAEEESVAMLLSGEPIDEPIVGYGPFVMNTKEEISQAIDDFNRGAFGSIY
jgi:redox-sensitive bicupin YhaK (pirin superfamily)